MVATDEDASVPPEAAAVATRYKRLERPISGVLALLIGAAVVLAVTNLQLVVGLGVAVGLLVAFRLPIFKSKGTAVLETDGDVESVQREFTSATPPVLPFQWGIADSVDWNGDDVMYDISYLFGLRSASMAVDIASGEKSDDKGVSPIELRIQAEGKPWATYKVSIHEQDGMTRVAIEWTSDRRFGLRRLPQRLIAERYHADALSAQGYTTIERTRYSSIW
ncbi:hypothetical protein [Halococcus sp. PRR34]|uniref:hypothetical protein n=1 Tax=Halococcus sp. PRR34 TaxID=3020830 RepID=UPI0023627665|nr:hypothetical protein [Halococcus sp. PRR34]